MNEEVEVVEEVVAGGQVEDGPMKDMLKQLLVCD